MDRMKIGPTALARLVGTSKQNVDRWRKQERELVAEWAKRLAPHLETTAEVLLLLAPSPIPETPVRGRVGAGDAVINVDEDTSDLSGSERR